MFGDSGQHEQSSFSDLLGPETQLAPLSIGPVPYGLQHQPSSQPLVPAYQQQHPHYPPFDNRPLGAPALPPQPQQQYHAQPPQHLALPAPSTAEQPEQHFAQNQLQPHQLNNGFHQSPHSDPLLLQGSNLETCQQLHRPFNGQQHHQTDWQADRQAHRKAYGQQQEGQQATKQQPNNWRYDAQYGQQRHDWPNGQQRPHQQHVAQQHTNDRQNLAQQNAAHKNDWQHVAQDVAQQNVAHKNDRQHVAQDGQPPQQPEDRQQSTLRRHDLTVSEKKDLVLQVHQLASSFASTSLAAVLNKVTSRSLDEALDAAQAAAVQMVALTRPAPAPTSVSVTSADAAAALGFAEAEPQQPPASSVSSEDIILTDVKEILTGNDYKADIQIVRDRWMNPLIHAVSRKHNHASADVRLALGFAKQGPRKANFFNDYKKFRTCLKLPDDPNTPLPELKRERPTIDGYRKAMKKEFAALTQTEINSYKAQIEMLKLQATNASVIDETSARERLSYFEKHARRLAVDCENIGKACIVTIGAHANADTLGFICGTDHALELLDGILVERNATNHIRLRDIFTGAVQARPPPASLQQGVVVKSAAHPRIDVSNMFLTTRENTAEGWKGLQVEHKAFFIWSIERALYSPQMAALRRWKDDFVRPAWEVEFLEKRTLPFPDFFTSLQQSGIRVEGWPKKASKLILGDAEVIDMDDDEDGYLIIESGDLQHFGKWHRPPGYRLDRALVDKRLSFVVVGGAELDTPALLPVAGSSSSRTAGLATAEEDGWDDEDEAEGDEASDSDESAASLPSDEAVRANAQLDQQHAKTGEKRRRRPSPSGALDSDFSSDFSESPMQTPKPRGRERANQDKQANQKQNAPTDHFTRRGGPATPSPPPADGQHFVPISTPQRPKARPKKKKAIRTPTVLEASLSSARVPASPAHIVRAVRNEPIVPKIEVRTSPIVGDGHCGFRVAALALYGNQDAWPSVRKLMLDQLEKFGPSYAAIWNPADANRLRNRLQHESGEGIFASTANWFNTTDCVVLLADLASRPIIIVNRSEPWRSYLMPPSLAKLGGQTASVLPSAVVGRGPPIVMVFEAPHWEIGTFVKGELPPPDVQWEQRRIKESSDGPRHSWRSRLEELKLDVAVGLHIPAPKPLDN
ncbi:hypothetical protein OC835_000164 [Tilletia horrida]|nr:hypothetical protein OC835_000164 [Tilletia horrida]